MQRTLGTGVKGKGPQASISNTACSHNQQVHILRVVLILVALVWL